MEILALIGSPRKGGNTDALADVLLEKALENGHRTKKVYLHDHRIGPCIDCRACKREPWTCPLPDDMPSIYAALQAADLIVFATPVYWFGPTGPMKQLLDRLRPYYANRALSGKGAVLVAVAGDGPAQADLLEDLVRRSLGALDVSYLGSVLATGYDRGDVLRDTAALDAAASLGASLEDS